MNILDIIKMTGNLTGLSTEPYLTQLNTWPDKAKHIFAHYNKESVVVYQAYKPSIGHFAGTNNYFAEDFSFERMSWIKTSFLWMMYRSNWGTKLGQEVTLAIWLRQSAFNLILAEAIHSNFEPSLYSSKADWQKAVLNSSVRIQWDPDHDPKGSKLERRAVQLGLRGNILANYAKDWILHIEDISDFVALQRQFATPPYHNLIIPKETLYNIQNEDLAKKLGLSIVAAS